MDSSEIQLPAEAHSSGSALETEQEIVQDIAGHLALWCESVENGYGHVSYREERVRDSAIVALKSALIEYDLPLHAPEMPEERTVEDFVRGLTRRLETLPPGVVSLVWSDRLLSELGSRYDLIRALNSSRERLKQPHLRQVWWMPVDFLEQFVLNALDLDSWFFCRLSLPDVPAPPQMRFETESPLPSVFMVPIKRNPNFTGRDDTLQKLETALNEGKNALVTQAISGLGGVGKTETVAEFAYRHANEYKFVLWAQSDHPDTLDAEYRRIARELRLPESEAREAETVRKAVIHWLENEPNYLLILDNADNPSILPPFMPAKPTGHILLTSRSQRFPESIALQTIRLGIFSQEQSAAFLLESVYPKGASKDEEETIQLLAKELGGLPLALELASAYMRVRRLPPSEYLEDFRKRRDGTLQRLGPIRGDYRETVLTTWSRNFEEIQRVSPASAELLRICAFLSPDSIPFSIFEKGYSALPEENELRKALERNTESGFEELLAVPESYSLIEADKAGRTFSIHRLVQDALRLELPEEARKEFVEKAILILIAIYPGEDFIFWSTLNGLLPHQQSILKFVEDLSVESESISVLLNQTAVYLQDQAKYEEAKLLYLRANTICEKLLGADHLSTATNLNNLAGLYRAQGRYAEAEPLYLRDLAISEKQLGADHPDTGQSLNNLAELYRNQGKYDEAEPLYRRAVGIFFGALGAQHPSSITVMRNHIILLSEMGRLEAELPSLPPEYMTVLKTMNLPSGASDELETH